MSSPGFGNPSHPIQALVGSAAGLTTTNAATWVRGDLSITPRVLAYAWGNALAFGRFHGGTQGCLAVAVEGNLGSPALLAVGAVDEVCMSPATTASPTIESAREWIQDDLPWDESEPIDLFGAALSACEAREDFFVPPERPAE